MGRGHRSGGAARPSVARTPGPRWTRSRRYGGSRTFSSEPASRRIVYALRTAAATISGLSAAEVSARTADGTLTTLPGIGKVTAEVVREALAGVVPSYLQRLEEADQAREPETGGAQIRAALRGDLHTHSDWSDGGSPIEEMAATARDLGHQYAVLTDHSPRLTVANGLSPPACGGSSTSSLTSTNTWHRFGCCPASRWTSMKTAASTRAGPAGSPRRRRVERAPSCACPPTR